MSERTAGDNPPDLNSTSLTRLLSLGIQGKERPIDELLRHLATPEGQLWFQKECAEGPLRAIAGGGRRAAAPPALDALLALHRDSKRRLHAAGNKEERLSALLSYFISIAAALIHHQHPCTRRPRSELDPLFLDLAASLPEPWSEFISRAVEYSEPRQ